MPDTLFLPHDDRRASWFRALRRNAGFLASLVLIAWVLEILDLILPGTIDGFGIRPRTFGGIFGIAFAPFLHQGSGHLASNSLPFLFLGGIVLIGGRALFIRVSIVILALSGAALWTLGPGNTNHIGASMLIFGYLGFLIARGFVERSPVWTLVSIGVLVFYGGMIGGVLPGQPGVSWQGHLFGFIAGVIAARIHFSPPHRDRGTRFGETGSTLRG